MILNDIARAAILKVASEVSFTGAGEFGRLTKEEESAWEDFVARVRAEDDVARIVRETP